MLELPRFEDFDPEQDDILNLPLDESHLVTGPPGSGKTIMAILRAEMLTKVEEPTLLLMYGKLLSSYTTAAVSSRDIEGIVSTYHSWFPRFFRRTYRQDPPREDEWTFDWRACWEIILDAGAPPPKERFHIIVDEGQDMPRDFYSVLSMLGRTVTVFADDNQQITDHNCTVDEIQKTLGLHSSHQLKRNHRNTERIAEVAAEFYTGLPSGIAAMPDGSDVGEKPVLVHHPRIYEEAQMIANFSSLHPGWTIGVLVPYTNQQKTFYNRLKDKVEVPVGVYSSDHKLMKQAQGIDFGEPGIRIVNHMSAKGLEFDVVFLPELQGWHIDHCGLEFRRRMYVLASRAKRELFMMYAGDGEPGLVPALPLHLLDRR